MYHLLTCHGVKILQILTFSATYYTQEQWPLRTIASSFSTSADFLTHTSTCYPYFHTTKHTPFQQNRSMLLTFSCIKFLPSTYLGYTVGYGDLYPHASTNRTPSRHCRLPVFSRWRSSCHCFMGRKSVRLGSIHRECTSTTTVCSKFDDQGIFIDHLCCSSFCNLLLFCQNSLCS